MSGFTFCLLPDRGVLRLSGDDRISFLQALVSNDVAAVSDDRAIYAALLTPQGRFLHDMFIIASGADLYLDVDAARRADLLRRLTLYKLRAKISLTDVSGDDQVVALSAPLPQTPTDGLVFADPRHPALFYRALLPKIRATEILQAAGGVAENVDSYHRRRIMLAIPDAAHDLVPEKSLLLENNIDHCHGIGWNKGCYIGQELTARMRYRGLLKKRLLPVRWDGDAPPAGEDLLLPNGDVAAEMRGAVGDQGLALVRLEHLARATAQGLIWQRTKLHLSLTPELIRQFDLDDYLTTRGPSNEALPTA